MCLFFAGALTHACIHEVPPCMFFKLSRRSVLSFTLKKTCMLLGSTKPLHVKCHVNMKWGKLKRAIFPVFSRNCRLTLRPREKYASAGTTRWIYYNHKIMISDVPYVGPLFITHCRDFEIYGRLQRKSRSIYYSNEERNLELLWSPKWVKIFPLSQINLWTWEGQQHGVEHESTSCFFMSHILY